MATAVDLKAGFCSACRRGAHVMCQSARCDCDSTRSHPNRPRPTSPAKAAAPSPAAARVAAPPPATNGTPKKSEAGLDAPIFERVREDPPETVRKPRVSAADQVLPILEDIKRVGDDHAGSVAPGARRLPDLCAKASRIRSTVSRGSGRPAAASGTGRPATTGVQKLVCAPSCTLLRHAADCPRPRPAQCAACAKAALGEDLV